MQRDDLVVNDLQKDGEAVNNPSTINITLEELMPNLKPAKTVSLVSQEHSALREWFTPNFEHGRGASFLRNVMQDPEDKLLRAEHVPHINKEPLSELQDIFKVGRTTGLRVGKRHALKACVFPERPSNSRYIKPKRTTFEQVVIQAKYPLLFNTAGHSGAWILDETACLVGLAPHSVSREFRHGEYKDTIIQK